MDLKESWYSLMFEFKRQLTAYCIAPKECYLKDGGNWITLFKYVKALMKAHFNYKIRAITNGQRAPPISKQT